MTMKKLLFAVLTASLLFSIPLSAAHQTNKNGTAISKPIPAASSGTNLNTTTQTHKTSPKAPADHSEAHSMAHHMMILAIQLGIIIFAARLFGSLFKKYLKMPSVLGELFAGIVIGGHLLGGISLPGFPHGLFGAAPGAAFPVSTELYAVATIASIILLFLAGLETDVAMFIKFSVTGSMVGLGGVVFSFVFGDLTAVFFSELISEKPISFMHPIALFLGTISTATSVGITARILSEKRKMDSPEGVSILSGAVIDDVLGIIILAIVLGISSVQKSGGQVEWGKIGLIAAKAIGFWLAATALGMLFAKKIGRFLKNFGAGSMASLALGSALLLAGISEMAGLAMIIGAYIMGLSLSQTDLSHEIQEKLSGVYRFFVPVFFAVMGMLVDFSAFSSLDIILFAAIYTVIAIVSKMIGSSIPALGMGFNMRGAIRIGLGMVPRGEVALIVAGIGLSAGIIPNYIFGIAVMMTLITTVIAPPGLVWAFNNPARGTRKEISTKNTEEELSVDFKNEKTTELFMDKLVQTFKEEEFFVHLVDMETGVLSARKNDIFLTIRHLKQSVEIDCHNKDLQYVKFVITESILGLVEIIEEIKDASDLKAKPRELLTS